MQIVEDHLSVKAAYEHLDKLYHISQPREGIHLSTVIYCLTRSYYDLTLDDVAPTPQEVLLFALGYGLQDILTPEKAVLEVVEKDGIFYSPDYKLKLGDTHDLYELKTTRMSAKKGDEHEFPETWIEYMKGGCFIQNVNEYRLVVLYMMGDWKPPFPSIKGYNFTFTDEELIDNWGYIMERKVMLEASLLSKSPPTPRAWCKDWECSHCRYKVLCDALKVIGDIRDE